MHPSALIISCACVYAYENSKSLSSYTTIPKPRGIPPSVCSGTSNLDNPMQKAEPCLTLRTRGGRLKTLLSHGNSPYTHPSGSWIRVSLYIYNLLIMVHCNTLAVIKKNMYLLQQYVGVNSRIPRITCRRYSNSRSPRVARCSRC